MKRAFGVAAIVLVLPAAARADDAPATARCGAERTPWILVRTDPADVESRAHLLSQLRASLATRGLDACAEDEATLGRPVATLQVSSLAADVVVTTIVVNDPLTDKRVARDIDLRATPVDSRPLTVALALDELLRASWAELMLVDAHRTAEPVPPVVTAAITETSAEKPPPPAPPPTRRKWQLGAAIAGEHFGEGQDELGADVTAVFFPFTRIGVHARAGVRGGFSVAAPDGDVRSTALVLAAGPDLALLPAWSRARLDVFAEALVARVDFSATASGGATGRDETGVAAFANLGVRAGYTFASTFIAHAGIGAGAPLHGVRVKDAEARITGLGGPLIFASAGGAWSF